MKTTIKWKRCNTYEEAQHFTKIIYLHEWDGKPFYWGKAHKSFFGGHMRTRDGIRASGRYNAGYRHWIEGCLRHGARLYVGQLDEEGTNHIDALESHLIGKYGSVMNSRAKIATGTIEVEHKGDVPDTIKGRPNQAMQPTGCAGG